MTITVEVATVFRGGGRRWFTRKAAIRAEAKACYRKVSNEKDRCGCDYIDDDCFGCVPHCCDYHDYESKVMGRYLRYASHCIEKASPCATK